jgi:hypothetical protein
LQLIPIATEDLDALVTVQLVVDIFAAEFAGQFGVENISSGAASGIKEIFAVAIDRIEIVLDGVVIAVLCRISNRRQ